MSMDDPSATDIRLLEALSRADAPHRQKLPPDKWVKQNLFNTWYNALITVVFGVITTYLAYRSFRFVFVTGRWDPIERNLELFMVGQYPREERWRIVAQILMMGGAIGMVLGLLRSAARDTAIDTGEPFEPEGWRTYARSYWAIAVFVLVLLLGFVDTIGPWLLALGTVALMIAGRLLTFKAPRSLRPLGWTVAGLVAALSFQMLSGTGGWAWFFTSLTLLPAISGLVPRLPPRLVIAAAGVGVVIGVGAAITRPGVVGYAALLLGAWAAWSAWRGDRIDAARLALLMVGAVVVYLLYDAIGLEGIDWSEWGGFHLNLVAATAAIILAFPLGILLALGRRSDLPVIRYLSVAYIEFFRGAPLITFLLAAAFFLQFFLASDTPLSLITRAIAAVTLFSAAYVAEIIRGGLQAVPPGQIEAGQSLGLSAPKIMRLIVMPQALRAVIPAMVGQFISLFKDTTLFTIISIPELLDVRGLVHAQAEFRGFGIAETLTFVAFGFWAVAFTMSRESQRLERRLGVGLR